MRVSECPGLTRVQERKIKIAVEGTCELCSGYFALPLLEIHRISRRLYREMVRDPSARILVVCDLCHRHIHRLPVRVKDQRAMVSRRPYFVRQEIRKALGYTPKPYIPPRDAALSEMYEVYFYHFPPGSFRLGG
ncbi:hypothetical protein [Methanoregula sp.]|uniref:hypothetical protein n=1 Tax=Methanoregula sp. TaxID=2052170 RepID=UPI003BB09011